jgi:arylsulfatase A-like enzyme
MKAIVIVVHGWNVGWLGPYGNEWVLTPNLDCVAAEGVVFDQHIADVPDPALAWRTLWSGRYSFRAPSNAAKPPRRVPLAALPDGGIQTIWLPDLRSSLHPEQEECWDTVITPRRDAESGPEVALIAAVEAGLDLLTGDTSSLFWIETDRPLPPWSINDDVFAAYFDACGPLLEEDEDATASDGKPVVDEMPPPWADPPSGEVQGLSERDWRRLAASVASVTSQLDTELGEIFERLREAGLDRDCLWLMTASAGLPLGEHRHIGYRHPSLHEERTHVPLMLRLPDGRQAGRRVSALTQPVDILPTLMEWFQLPLPSGVHGKSLLPLATRRCEPIRQYAVSGLQVGDARDWVLQTPQWKLILPAPSAAEDAVQRAQLFEKPDDRWEVNDLRAKHLEWAEHLEQCLHGFVEAAAADGPLVPPVLQTHDAFLKALSPAGEPGKDNL